MPARGRAFSPKAKFVSRARFRKRLGRAFDRARQVRGVVDAVEIDQLALEHSREEARRNGVEGSIRFSRAIEAAAGEYDLIVANILRPVLMEFAPTLARALKRDGTLVLSGVVATDVPILRVKFSEPLGGLEPQVFREGEWCCLVWKRSQ